MADPYATKVLRKDAHERLVANIEAFARDAGIQPRWIWTALDETCNPDIVQWVRRFKFHQAGGQVQGFCMIRSGKDSDPAKEMAAIAGALVRNFIRARVIALGAVLDEIAKDGPPEATCLLIPNFFTPKAEGGTIATWQVSALYDLLVRRARRACRRSSAARPSNSWEWSTGRRSTPS